VTIDEAVPPGGSAPVALFGGDPRTVLEFRGRFRAGLDRWVEVPFDVPPGIRRISVELGHDRYPRFGASVRNVVDLGIFGPGSDAAGFRGWSGGARRHFTLAATNATPGYLPGPIVPGRWRVVLGPVVLSPFGMAWWLRVELEHGEGRDEVAAPVPPALAVPGSGPGWYRGDLHLHSVHSDGDRDLDELAAAARTAGLHFIASTEHNTNSANRVWGTHELDGLLVIAGQEVTTWTFGYRDVDAIEVWNGAWNVDDEVSLRIWQALLRRGRRPVAVAGSDSHGTHQPVGSPQTVVNAASLTTPAIVAALRAGHAYPAGSAEVEVDLSASVRGPAPRVGPGGTLAVAPNGRVTVRATVAGAPRARLTLISAAGPVARTTVGPTGVGTVSWTTTGPGARFARIEVRRASGGNRPAGMLALTNPIWLVPTRP
jgi:hypothetical protein